MSGKALAAIILLWSVSAAGSAIGAPVYLSCHLAGSGPPIDIDIAADESSQMVTYTFTNDGSSYRVPAAFAPATLSFPMGEIVIASVDRSTLKIHRQADGLNGKMVVDSGRCTLQKQPKGRAF